MGTSREKPSDELPKVRPATTPEAQEMRMMSLAINLAEQQLVDGTASTQIISRYLQMASSREKAEMEKLRLENELLKAKTEQLGSQAQSADLAAEAINAFRKYAGQSGEGDTDYEDT